MKRSFNETFEAIPATGWLSRPEAALLWKYASVAEGPILEVGCYHGRSTCLLAEFSRPVFSVDPFSNFSAEDPSGDKTMESFLENLRIREIDNVYLFRGGIESFRFPRLVGLAYLDGDHTYRGTANQIEIALKGNPKYVLIHDVNDDGGGLEVKRAAVERLGEWAERVERLAVWEVAK